MHILKKFPPRLGKKGSRTGGSPNSLLKKQSAKALYFLIFLSFSFIFFHFLSFSFIVFFLFFLLSSCSSFFSGAQNTYFFLPWWPHDLVLKLLCQKSFFGPSREVPPPIGPFFFLLFIFHVFFSFSFSFSISFHAFPFFLCFFLFTFFITLFFLKKKFFLFRFVSFFSFLGCSKSVAALQDSLGKSAHSELALFALYWLVVTFHCGRVHILVMINLRGWVKSYLRTIVARLVPSMRRLTHLSLVSSLFSLLFSCLSSFIFSFLLFIVSSWLVSLSLSSFSVSLCLSLCV